MAVSKTMSSPEAIPTSSLDEKNTLSSKGDETSEKHFATTTVSPIAGHAHQIKLSDADEAAKFVAGFSGEVTEEQSKRGRHYFCGPLQHSIDT